MQNENFDLVENSRFIASLNSLTLSSRDMATLGRGTVFKIVIYQAGNRPPATAISARNLTTRPTVTNAISSNSSKTIKSRTSK